MGCGQTLFAASGGYVTCSLLGCPNPTAVSDILEDRETEHLVTIDAGSFTVRHPLRERLDDNILTCSLGEFVAGAYTSMGALVRAGGHFRARHTKTPAGSATWIFTDLTTPTKEHTHGHQ
jgi:hypothetical protein